MTAYAYLHPGLERELKQVEALLLAQADSGVPEFDKVLSDWLGHTGKLLRPALFLIAGHVFEPWHVQNEMGDSDSLEARLCKNAAAIELIHMATLVHDDVVDEATLRRGHATVSHKMGKDYAIYMGDYLFCKALMLVSNHEVHPRQLKDLSAGMTQVCLGEIRQYHCRFSLKPDLRSYYKIIAGKTAALFALSLYSGAIEAGAEENLARRFGKIGYNMGMAFQIIDDLLDYSEMDIGKKPLKDLEQGYYTLPIQLALKSDGGIEIKSILEGLQGFVNGAYTHDALMTLLHRSGALNEAKKQAKRFSQRALKYVQRLPEGDSRDTLKILICELLERQI